jgi:hypothetical protein
MKPVAKNSVILNHTSFCITDKIYYRNVEFKKFTLIFMFQILVCVNCTVFKRIQRLYSEMSTT